MLFTKLNPTHDNFRSCMEDQIASIASWFQRDFQLMYAQSLKIQYSPNENPNLSTAGRHRINLESISMLNSLEKYHGIQRIENTTTADDKLLKALYRELKEGHPNIVFLNSYYLHWLVNYKRASTMHNCSVIGFKEDFSKVYCSDSFFMKDCVEIDKEEFLKGCRQNFISFKLSAAEENSVKWQDVIEDSIVSIEGLDSSQSSFDSIRCFAEDIRASLDLKSEISNQNDIWSSPILMDINWISHKRVKFAELLEYLSQKGCNKDLGSLAQTFRLLSSKWNINYAMTVKAYNTGNTAGFKEKLSSKILDMVTAEEKALNSLKSMLLRPQSASCLPGKTNSEGLKVLKLDITDYFNNHGFGDYKDINCNSDFTGLGECLLIEDAPKGGELTTTEGCFIFPDPLSLNCDNISCNGQTIIFPENKYSEIKILGCCEWGSFSEKLIINFSDGSFDEKVIDLTDFYYSTPLCGDKAVLKVHNSRRDNLSLREERYIYCQTIKAASEAIIKSITLPNRPNMHIFAVNLLYKLN
ncbi:MAG TPA: BtrH N-terminal domain-containing protein [Clostridia bacterium]|nr:BtrH N-terminal domain-containing protein [Clostridia bacterium]